MSSPDANKELVRRYLNAFNNRDHDTISEVLADDVIEHSVHKDLHGPDEILAFLQKHFDRFPDYSGTTDAMIAEGDTVAVRYTVSGTHTDEFHDVEPTGHTVEWTGLAMYRIADGHIAEIWIEEDRLGLLEQLEAVDPPAHLRV